MIHWRIDVERIPLIFGKNIFDETELQSALARVSGKWVLHLKALGLLKFPERVSDFMDWYADKSNLEVINAVVNSDKNSREVYILLDTKEEIEHAYEHWFPTQLELHEDEYYLFIKLIAVNPDGIIILTNEAPES